MKLLNTMDPTVKPSILMVVYGEGGVGKTTFAASAPKPIIADCENGSKYFGLRGISADVAVIESWSDMKEFIDLALGDKYETIVIDPIGELMEKLMRFMVKQADSKLVQKDGAPTMAGWGWLKQKMRNVLKLLRDSGKNVVIVAHVEEKDDEGRMVKRPMVATKLSEELVNMVDIVGYMTTVNDTESGESKRVIFVDPSSDKLVAKDRTGRLGRFIEPDFTKIVDGVRGDKSYSWIKPAKQKPASKEKVADVVSPPMILPQDPELVVDEDFKMKLIDQWGTIGLNSMGKMWFFKTVNGRPYDDFAKLDESDWRQAYYLIQDILNAAVQVTKDHLGQEEISQ